MAIKEEQYDPGYEDAFGGVYAEKGAEGAEGAGGAEGSGAAAGPGGAEGSGAPSQTNGHCTFSSADNTGNAVECVLLLHILLHPDLF